MNKNIILPVDLGKDIASFMFMAAIFDLSNCPRVTEWHQPDLESGLQVDLKNAIKRLAHRNSRFQSKMGKFHWTKYSAVRYGKQVHRIFCFIRLSLGQAIRKGYNFYDAFDPM